MHREIIYKLVIVSVISIFSILPIYAENVDISIDPIFTQEEGIWYPGRVEDKDFYITNNKEDNISIDKLYMELKSSKDMSNNQILDINSKQFKELAKNSTVKLSNEDTVLFEESLDKLLSEKGIVLLEEIDIKSNEKALLNMIIDMDEEMNNDAQALESIFSIGVAYKIDDTKQPIKPDPPVNPPINPDPPIKPGTGVGGESDKLPQTGGVVNSASLICIGTIAIGTGLVLNKKSSQEKGGKHHE